MVFIVSFHREFDDFLEDLEEDQVYRHNVNIYKGNLIGI